MNTPHPARSLFLLFALLIGCSFGAQIIALLIVYVLSLVSHSPSEITEALQQDGGKTYILLAASSTGTFLLPPYFLKKYDGIDYLSLHRGKIFNWTIALLSVLCLSAFSPLMSVISEWNQGMSLPSALHGVEAWIKKQEDSMAALTESLVMTQNVGILLLNIVVIAILPAIGEEVFFRATLQTILQKWIRNPHIAIWLCAIIFSAIHFQFYGFFPRLLLGAFFGYLYHWTKSLLYPIIAHFINNATVVIVAYDYSLKQKSYEQLMSTDSYSLWIYLVAAVASVTFATLIYKLSTNNSESSHGKRLG